MEFDVVVIGGGLAGLSSAIRLSELGKRCAVMSAGQSALYFSSGSLDLLGHLPDGTPVTAPLEALPALALQAPQHPYSKIGAARVAVLAQEAQALLERSAIPMFGDSTKNHQRITPLGTRRSTWLSPLDVPVTAMDGLLPWRNVIVVGIEGFLDFQPEMVASSLAAEQGIAAEVAYLHLPVLDQLRNNPSEFRSANIARVLDLPENSAVLAEDLMHLAADAECIILPACIGLDDSQKLETLRARIGRPVYQLPTLPPSLLGMRLYNALRQRLSRLGGIYMPGDRALKADFDGRRITGIYTRNHADMALQARQVVLATGSFFSNGLVAARDRIYEPVFGLDVWSAEDRNDWSQTDFFDPQPYLQFGVKTDNDMRALMDERPLDNLYVIGAVLGGYNPLQQGCGAGVSLISALHVAHRIVAALEAKS